MRKILLIIMVVLGCFACETKDHGPNFGTEEECLYDGMQLKGHWEQIVNQASASPVQSLACTKVVQLAQYRLGLAGKEAIGYCLSNTKEVITSVTAAMMMSDVYIQLGYPSLAERAAFEAMVKTSDEALKQRALQRLTETAIITRQYEVARKYLFILEEKGANRQWLQTMKRMAEQPATIQENPTFKNLQEQYDNTEDQFFM